MENIKWDEARYRELNGYFKEKIQHLLETDPHLQQSAAAGKSITLTELVESMSLNDQVSWQEFLRLDQLKMQLDLQNHLEGKGAPLHDTSGFYRSGNPKQEQDNPLW